MFCGLPAIKDQSCFRQFAFHEFLVGWHLGGQFDHIAVRIAQIERVHEAMIDWSPRVCPSVDGPLFVFAQLGGIRYFQCNMQIQIRTLLKETLVRISRQFEKGEERVICQFKEAMKWLRVGAARPVLFAVNSNAEANRNPSTSS